MPSSTPSSSQEAATTRFTSSVSTSFFTSNDTTTHLNVPTSSHSTVTYTAANSSLVNVTVVPPQANYDGAIAAGHVVAIVLFTAAIMGVAICIYCYFKGKLNSRRFHIISRFKRGRLGSSSGSRRPLENEEDDDDERDDLDPAPSHSRPRNDADLFTIGDVEDNDHDRRRGKHQEDSNRNSQEPLDEGYFYDEVFGESAFEDEATRTALKELTLSSGEEDLPDLEFRDNP